MKALKPTKSVLDIASRLEEAGFEAWCVGGAIRDALLGGTPLDWDLATSARPEQVQELFGRKRTIPVGIEFGTVAVLDQEGVPHEITTFRRDVRTDGRHAEVEFGASLEDDLARRDFTINAIAFRPATGDVRDPFGGERDLRAGIIRAVGRAEERMKEDRLRALRGIRFAARYDFAIDGETRDAIVASAAHLTRLSAERVQQELVKTMQQVAKPSRALALWRDTGALSILIPALGNVTDVALMTSDYLPRAGAAGRATPQRTINRVAALFLDCPDEVVRSSLVALRFSRSDVSWAGALVDAWHREGDRIAALADVSHANDDAAVRRAVAGIGRVGLPAFMRVAGARWCAMRLAGQTAPAERVLHSLHKRLMRARFSAIELADLAISGDDLRAAGIRPGPAYAKILHALLDRVLESPARNTPEALLAELPEIVAALNGGVASPPQH